MSLEANKRKRLHDLSHVMHEIFNGDDFAAAEIAEYKKLLFELLDLLDGPRRTRTAAMLDDFEAKRAEDWARLRKRILEER